jgi:hypothetical protein
MIPATNPFLSTAKSPVQLKGPANIPLLPKVQLIAMLAMLVIMLLLATVPLFAWGKKHVVMRTGCHVAAASVLTTIAL